VTAAAQVICPRCAVPLGAAPAAWANACARCGATFPVVAGVPCLFADADAWLTAWRRQLDTFDAQVRQTVRLLDEARREADLLPAAALRLETFRAATAALRDELFGLLDAPLALHAPRTAQLGDVDAREARPLTHYLELVFRDWAWEPDVGDGGGEVSLAIAELEAVAGPAPLGRVLVLGAGACRLPYELHRRGRAQRTIALDVDVLLLAAARAVIAGEPLALTEAPAEANDLDALARRHALAAPAGPLTGGTFQLVLANGLEPPFDDASFDTVLTPWFIDVATADLGALAASIHRLLAPEGRWLNVGPLVYTPRVPLARRHTAQEVVTLVQRAGFEVGAPRLSTTPYAMSPLNGRGRLERTLAFAARKLPPTR
jgi:SAM-dependent methyltransferase